jgi:cytidylate kinase
MSRRASVYAQAHATIDTENLSIDQVVEQVLRVLQ